MEKENKTCEKNIECSACGNQKKVYLITFLFIFVFMVVVWNIQNSPKSSHIEVNSNLNKDTNKFFVMGTVAETVIYAEPELAKKASLEVKEVFKQIERKCNIFNPESEVSRLNATAFKKSFKCSPLLWNLFNSSRHAYDISGGAFDVTARPLMQLWGFYRKRDNSIPKPEEINTVKAKVGLNKIKFDEKNHTVKFTVDGMSVDFGGIAKGIAVQIAVQKIEEMGIKHAVINLGGNMYCLGSPPAPKNFYVIGIKNPLAKDQICATMNLSNQATATSGNYERYVTMNGHHYTHIINPKTGMPIEDMLSVTVVSDNAGVADVLSTTIFINGVKFAESLCEKNPELGVFIIMRDPADNSKVKTFKFGQI
jgi:thiamine biosynthesis lipoprotein